MKKKFLKPSSIFMALLLVFQCIEPTIAWALTTGPTVPEVNSFEPVGTTQMVDLFSGDFNYNIPLLDVGGYPVNISYHSGVRMDEEASWVGLGWNLNPGCINRNVRGIPDDFNGRDKIVKTLKLKPNETFGLNVEGSVEFAGMQKPKVGLSYSIGINYNTYNGIGFTSGLGLKVQAGDGAKFPCTASLGLTSSDAGLDVTPSVNFQSRAYNSYMQNLSLGSGFNSRAGLKNLSIGYSPCIVQNKPINASYEYSFSTPTYTPHSTFPMENYSFALSFKPGTSFFILSPNLKYSGYYSRQNVAEQQISFPAYGYLNLELGQQNPKGMLDFNREKDGVYTKKTPCLPVTNTTYDIFNISGQGVVGSYRPYRSDIGYYFDSKSYNSSASVSTGMDLGSGQLLEMGGDFGIVDVTSTNGAWMDDNLAISNHGVGFMSASACDNLNYEPFYFKEGGEKTIDSDPEFFQQNGGDDPLRFQLHAMSFEPVVELENNLESNNQSAIPIANNNFRQKKQKRCQPLSFIKLNEYEKYATNKNLFSEIYGGGTRNISHHIGEMIVNKSDGTRYVYGIPAYNIIQKEVTYNVSRKPEDPDFNNFVNSNDFVAYNETDNSVENDRGTDNYFNCVETPPYAYSYLLTEVLSSDYVDLTLDGPTDDDLGNYTLFNYEKITNPVSWRTPFGPNVKFNENLKSIYGDDQGNYMYGEKEIYILKSIQTRNYRAEFVTNISGQSGDIERLDAYTCDENGNNQISSSRVLRKISLYLKSKIDGGIDKLLKEVHFVYDYSLCGNVYNNYNAFHSNPINTSSAEEYDHNPDANLKGGKLTLKKIYFTYETPIKAQNGPANYQGSFKAKLNSYKFSYNTINPDYDPNAYNMWGGYKPVITGGIKNSEYPYVDQTNRSQEDEYASAWSLDQINLPSGGALKVNYESDDYAYVQDKRAGQMFKISGVNSTNVGAPINSNDLSSGDYFVFKLNKPIDMVLADAQKDFQNRYGKELENLYYKFLVKVNHGVRNDGMEYVTGYIPRIDRDNPTQHNFELELLDYSGPNGYEYGTIHIIKHYNPAHNGSDINPIIKSALQFARIHTPREAFNLSDPNSLDPVEVLLHSLSSSLLGTISEIFQGPDKKLLTSGLGTKFDLSKSWFRLNSPDLRKAGGGLRVKSILMDDNWGIMTSNSLSNVESSSVYGQEFSYTTTSKDPAFTGMISSGVATYEPLIGGDENSLHQPVFSKEVNLLAPNNNYYMEEPFGECYFPGPSVGYSKIKVKSIHKTVTQQAYADVNVNKHGTGYLVHEFYTAKDFPVITKRTDIDPKRKKSNILLKILKVFSYDYMNASQGYSVILNDMHGKEKASWVYSEPIGNTSASINPDFGQLVSGVEYKYKTDNGRLNNHVISVNENGSVNPNSLFGIDFEMMADFREDKSIIINAGVQGNLYVYIVPSVPPFTAFNLFIWPEFGIDKTRFRSAVFTKVIEQKGLLEEVIAYDLGSKVSTSNLAYDASTGQVLLTKTVNEFKDDKFSFTYPAYWSYPEMGPASDNLGAIQEVSVDPVSGRILSFISTCGRDFISPGDELEIVLPSGVMLERHWAIFENGEIYLKNSIGVSGISSGTNSVCIKVLKSGRKNILTSNAGNIVSAKSLLPSGTNTYLDAPNAYNQIIDASATEYSEDWKTECGCEFIQSPTPNPYLTGRRGNWKPKKSYVYLSNRNSSHLNNNSNIRNDGYYGSFSPFWNLDPTAYAPSACIYANARTSKWNPPLDLNTSTSNWTWSSEVTLTSPYGIELENRDALNRYSAAQYNFQNQLPTAIAGNAQYKEIGFDSFEDYDFKPCWDSHFTFFGLLDPVANIVRSDEQHHTGRNSLKIPAGKSLIMTKSLIPCNSGNSNN